MLRKNYFDALRKKYVALCITMCKQWGINRRHTVSNYPDNFNADLHDILFSDDDYDRRTVDAEAEAMKTWQGAWEYAGTLGISPLYRLDFAAQTIEATYDFRAAMVESPDLWYEALKRIIADHRRAEENAADVVRLIREVAKP